MPSFPTNSVVDDVYVKGDVTWKRGFRQWIPKNFERLWSSPTAARPAATAPVITTTKANALQVGVVATPLTIEYTGTAATSITVTSGTLPAGLALSTPAGVITGTPTTAGAYSFTVTCTNATGSDTQAFTGTVAAASAAAPAFTTSALGTVEVDAAYSLTLVKTGTAPITFYVTAGALPAGLSLNSTTGAITGTPTAAGAYSVEISAVNATGTARRTFTGTVDEAS
jgi:hypothetical protein